MIANARMYGVSTEVAALWRELLSSIIAATGPGIAAAGQGIELLEHAAPAPIDELWGRADMAAVFMCGLPFARAKPQPVPVAAPVPSPAAFGGEPRYWSEFVVRRDSGFATVADAFGSRIAFTVPGSQSGCVAALSYLQAQHGDFYSRGAPPLFAEIIAPTVTPVGALEAVVGGAAEIAPIDAYAFELLRVHRPDLAAAVRVVGRTAPTPIPLLVASPPAAADGAGGIGVGEALAAAFLAAHLDNRVKPLMDRLLLERFVRPDPAAYRELATRFTAATQFWHAHPLAAVAHPAFVW
jgi:ABC-type phosphate/phosphonate transport system substrate-binding protein